MSGRPTRAPTWIDADGISDASNEVFNEKVNRFDLFKKPEGDLGRLRREPRAPYDIDETTGDRGQAGHALRALLRPRRARHQVGGTDVYTNNYLNDSALATIKKGDAAASLLPGLPAAAGRHRQVQRHRHQDRHAIGRHRLQVRSEFRLRDRAASPPLLRHRNGQDRDQT